MIIKSGKVSIAILDDYLDIGRPKFARLVDRVDIVTFPDTRQTINPEQREALIEHLYLFAIISTMRERTVLSADVLKCLSNLKLILTTDLKNAAIDIQTCKELGIAVA
jgi:lactate dehydrogenase-like 2-hydroxyacid dehydrogenase